MKKDALSINVEMPDFKLPGYNEIPAVGLFLEQVSKYINEYIIPIGCPELTGSMISNYVKKDIIDNPIKKQYNRDQIACLIFIAIAKCALSLEDINELLKLQKEVCDAKRAYEYFVYEFQQAVENVFEGKPLEEIKASDNKDKVNAKGLTRMLTITVAHKLYLDMSIAKIKNSDK